LLPRPPRAEISPDGALGSLEEQKTVAPLQRSSGERAAVAPIAALDFAGLLWPSLAYLCPSLLSCVRLQRRAKLVRLRAPGVTLARNSTTAAAKYGHFHGV